MRDAFQMKFASTKLFAYNNLRFGVSLVNKSDPPPLTYETKRVRLTLIGRIFNGGNERLLLFGKIAKSFQENNLANLSELLKVINGLFILILYNIDTNRLMLINDRYGMEPLYYHNKGKDIYIASEIKAIISNKEVERKIEWNFWKDFFQYGYAFGEKVPFKNIYSLPNGSMLQYEAGKVKIVKYWDYDAISINHTRSEKEFVEEGIEVLKRVFKRQVKNVGKSIVFLSGGFDSRCISCFLKFITKTPFINYSTDLHPSGGRLDYLSAKIISKALHVKNVYAGRPKNMYKNYFERHFFELDGLCTEHKWIGPLIDKVDEKLPHYDGIGGDILFRSPIISLQNVNIQDSKGLVDFFTNQIIEKGRRRECQYIYQYFTEPFSAMLKPDKVSMMKEFDKIENSENKSTIFYLKNRTRNAIVLSSRHLIGRKNYSYFPFFDNEFVEYALSVPTYMKMYGKLYFTLLKKAFPSIMKIPSTNDTTLNKSILDIEKSKSKRKVGQIIPDEDLVYLLHSIQNIKTPPFLKKKLILKQARNDIRLGIDPKKYLVSLLQFSFWYRRYMPKY